MNSLDKYNEDYEDYVAFCYRLNIRPLSIDKKWNKGEVSFYEHIQDILSIHEVSTEEELFKKLEDHKSNK